MAQYKRAFKCGRHWKDKTKNTKLHQKNSRLTVREVIQGEKSQLILFQVQIQLIMTMLDTYSFLWTKEGVFELNCKHSPF